MHVQNQKEFLQLLQKILMIIIGPTQWEKK